MTCLIEDVTQCLMTCLTEDVTQYLMTCLTEDVTQCLMTCLIEDVTQLPDKMPYRRRLPVPDEIDALLKTSPNA